MARNETRDVVTRRNSIINKIRSSWTYGKVRGLLLATGFKLGLSQSVTVDGTTVQFKHDGLQSYYSVMNSLREKPVVKHLLANVERGDVFYDIGANIGFYTCFVGRHAPDVSVVSFEPYPENVRLLSANIERNDVDATVVDSALAAEEGEATFTTMKTAAPGAQEAGLDNEHLRGRSDSSVSEITVEKVPGDTLVERGVIPPPTVVKMDAEGTGEAVLDGLESSLSERSCRLVYVEPHENDDAIASKLRGFGFDLEYVPLESRVTDAFIIGRRD